MKLACPECSAPQEVADDLPADSRLKCRRCGTRFSPGLTPAEDAPLDLDECEEEPTGRRTRVILLAASAGLALLLATIAVGWFATRPAKPDDAPSAAAPPAEPQPLAKADHAPPSAPPPRKPPGDGERLSAPALLDRYGADREQGARRYDGATLTVSGKMVGDAEQRADGEVVIGLSGSRPDGERVWCRMDPHAGAAAAHLPAGAGATVRGRCLGSGHRVGAANGFRVAGNVILADCVLVGEPFLPKPVPPPTPPASPTLPTPDGVDHPKGITEEGIEMRVTAVQVGHPVLVLGSGGPNAGATARTRERYLVLRLQITNKCQTTQIYTNADGSGVRLTDEKGNDFEWCRARVKPEPGSVLAHELEAAPKRPVRFRDEAVTYHVDPDHPETYLLVFSAEHLGKGRKLFLKLQNVMFCLRPQPEQFIRFDQAAVAPMAGSSAPDLSPAAAQAIDITTATAAAAAAAVLDAQVADVAARLSKGKTPADRIQAADDLRRMGRKAKGATAPLVQALFDPSTQVRLAALDTLKAVNPPVYGPVATLVAPLTQADALFMGSSGRPEAVAALANLGAEGRAAVPVLVWFKGQIAKPGGWPQVPEVLAALIKVAPDDPAVAALLVQSLARDEYGPARATAAVGLSYTKPTRQSVAALGQAVRGDPEPEVRLAAVNTLAAFGADAKAALKAVEAARKDPDQRVREAAHDAFEKIK